MIADSRLTARLTFTPSGELFAVAEEKFNTLQSAKALGTVVPTDRHRHQDRRSAYAGK
jgi:hypothetical protein